MALCAASIALSSSPFPIYFNMFFGKYSRLLLLLIIAAQDVVCLSHGLRGKRLNRHHYRPTVTPKVLNVTSTTSHITTPSKTPTQPLTRNGGFTSTATSTRSILHSSVNTTLSITTGSSSFTPNGIKAGIAGGDAYTFLQDHIGWWYDW